VAGIWCDMNEPSLFVPKQSTMPGTVVHPGGGSPMLHGQIHNTYGSLMARSAREGLLKLRPTSARSSSRGRGMLGSSATRCSGRATTRVGGSTCG
jgi:alpha-glucosidase (family GH31 glycosyl hydrolase)